MFVEIIKLFNKYLDKIMMKFTFLKCFGLVYLKNKSILKESMLGVFFIWGWNCKEVGMRGDRVVR